MGTERKKGRDEAELRSQLAERGGMDGLKASLLDVAVHREQ